MKTKLITITVMVMMTAMFCSCEKKADPTSPFVGLWKPIHEGSNCQVTGYYNDTIRVMRTFEMQGDCLFVKTADSKHSHGLDKTEHLYCSPDGDVLSYRSMVITTNDCGHDIKMVTDHLAYFQGGYLREDATYKIYQYYPDVKMDILIGWGETYAVFEQ